MGVAVSVPMEVNNFTAVASFRLKLTYNAAQLNCEGYANLRPELSDGFQAVISTPGEITLDWNGTSGLSFTGQTSILDLVFTPLQAGSSDIDWSTQVADSYFKRIDGSAISAQFSPGELTIYKPPEIILNANKTLCAGQTLSLMEIILWTQPELASEWTLPDGQVQNDSPFIFNVQASDAGDYTLQAIDQTGCSDQKTLHLEVSPIPIADFHGSDTLTVPSGYLLDAGQGLCILPLEYRRQRPKHTNRKRRLVQGGDGIAGRLPGKRFSLHPAAGRAGTRKTPLHPQRFHP